MGAGTTSSKNNFMSAYKDFHHSQDGRSQGFVSMGQTSIEVYLHCVTFDYKFSKEFSENDQIL